MYKQMLEKQRVLVRARGEVEAALRETLGMEVKHVAFVVAKEAFLAVLKKKTDLLNEADTVRIQL